MLKSKKILMLFTAVLIAGLAVAVFAFGRANVTSGSADCCPLKDSCPLKDKMKTQAADAKTGGDCCDDASCPLKNKTEQSAGVETKNVTMVGGDESCCQPGADCCKGGACCHRKS